ncbi:MAG: ABC transporter substrate-binding protein, partial [Actinomycetota bacterium]
MRKRVGTLIATLLAFSACSSGGDAIRFQVSAEVEEAAVYEALVSAFEKDHPEIDVELVPVANKDDHLARLSTLFAAGNPPEVFLVNFREYSQFVARGAIEPVADHIGDHGIDPDDYFDEPIEAFTYDGVLQCMPQNISSLVVYYN